MIQKVKYNIIVHVYERIIKSFLIILISNENQISIVKSIQDVHNAIAQNELK